MFSKKISVVKIRKVHSENNTKKENSSNMSSNEKLVSSNFLEQEKKSDPLKTLYDEYNCKVIIYGYVLVNLIFLFEFIIIIF